ncbi:hypothetical protein [Pararobbsia silviterrae]|uniref:hypothetical protein n=1 Tax=Pararobbsia silviterrae TaxID=1792498 RepID=UPI0011C39FB2|nr:hypothetical protein [Pararobbsia silviterrae]
MQNIFDTLAQEIDKAVAERGFLSVCDRAQALGFKGGRTDLTSAVGYRFERGEPNAVSLHLYARSYDPSGPDQVRPCITRFTVTAVENGALTQQYENEYEGLITL